MRTKLNKREIEALARLQDRLAKLQDDVEKNDVELHYGNGTASEQISCAVAALETILQEY